MSAHRSFSVASVSPRSVDGLTSSAIEEGTVQSFARTQTADRAGSAKRFAVLLAALLGLAALLVGWATPPYQSPDSFDHLRRAAAIASGQWVLTTPAGSSSGAVIDTGLQAHMALFMDMPHHTGVKVDRRTSDAAERIRFSGHSTFVVTPGTGPYAPPIYAVHAAGWSIGQALSLTVHETYRLVSLMVLLACVTILALAFRLRPPTPLTFALLALPMNVFQLGSPTIDGICTALFLLWMAIHLSGSEPGPRQTPVRSPWPTDVLLVALATVLVSSRLQMWPIFLLLAHRAWQRRSPALMAATFVGVAVVAAWLGWAMSHTVDGRVVRSHTMGHIVVHYLTRPTEFANVLVETLTYRWHFYARSFIGILGWLDVKFKLLVYGLFILLLLIVAATDSSDRRRRSLDQGLVPGLRIDIVLASCAALSVITVFLTLLVSWTPFPSSAIEGVQGRYFLPAILMAVASWKPQDRDRMPSSRAIALAVVVVLCSTVASVLGLQERYSPDAPRLSILSPGNELP